MSRQHAYRTRAQWPDFAAEWQDALEVGVDALRLHARRLAMGYYTRPRTVAGERVDVPIMSTTVLLRLLEAHDPAHARARERRSRDRSPASDDPPPWDPEAWLAELG